MRPPFVRDPNQPPRPPRTLRELRRRRRLKQHGDNTESLFDKLFYALLTALLYAFGGFLLDGAIAIIRSIMNMGDGGIYWLFTPFLAILGAIIGFLAGKQAGADSMDMLRSTDDPLLDDYSIRHDIFRGIGAGVLLFAIVWLIMLIVI